MLQRITAGFKLPLLTARSWVSLKGVRRHKMFRAKRRAPKAPDARGVRGYAPRKILKISVLSTFPLHSESIIPFWLTTYRINCVIFFPNI